jgi:hypothetical protein
VKVRGLIAVFLFLLLVVGVGNLWATHEYVNQFKAQQAQQAAIQRTASELAIAKICASFHKIAILKPPPGNPNTNPARGYDQQLHAALASVYADLECK